MKAISNSSECPKCGGEHKSRPFCLYSNGWYCFSCGYAKAADRSFSSAVERKIPKYNLPDDATKDYDNLSLEIKKYLLKFHVDSKLFTKHNIYGCSSDDSLFYCGEDDFYQRRWVLEKNRKIVTRGAKSPTYFDRDSKCIVLVEDFISAIRVGELYSVICLWGTSISDDNLRKICQKHETIYTWLDNDSSKEINSGQIAAAKIKNNCSYHFYKYYYNRGYTTSTVRKCINIATEKDPKFYTKNEIREIIRNSTRSENAAHNK